VTGVDSTEKLDMLRSVGVDDVVDYTREDFTQSGETYDVIFDVVGKASFSDCMRSLKEGGSYLSANPGLSQMLRGRWVSATSGKRVVVRGTAYESEGLIFLRELIEAGTIRTVVDRRYPLEQIPEAHRYVEKGGKKGSVVITVEHHNRAQ
jgi:NADPH:quinone reductase-like Zn-dependent oxidoreductase